MTSVTRLKNLLDLLNENEKIKILDAWQNIFNIPDIFQVYVHLSQVKVEIELLEKELIESKLINNDDYKNIITSFTGIISHPYLSQTVNQIPLMNKDNTTRLSISLNSLETFNTAGYIKFKYEEEVESDKFDNFKNSILETIEKIEASDMPLEDKKIFLSIFYDFNKAISLYKINGLDAFWEVVQNNICKIKMIDDTFSDNDNKYKEIKGVLLKSLDEVWFWIQMYQKVDSTLKIASKAYGYLKNKVTELTENIDNSELLEE